MIRERVRSADVVPAAIPYVCKAVNDLMAKGEFFEAGDLLGAIEAGLPQELSEFATVSFMRVFAGLQFAASEGRVGDVDPVQSMYGIGGNLVRCIDLSFLRACLVVPVYMSQGAGGVMRAAIDPVALENLTKRIEAGEPPATGMWMH